MERTHEIYAVGAVFHPKPVGELAQIISTQTEPNKSASAIKGS